MSIKKLLINECTVGSDVEFLVRDKESGEIVSAEGIIQGTKHEPFHFDAENAFYATSLDNVLAEGNIPPTTDALDFYLSIEKLRKYIDSVVSTKNLETVAIPSAKLDFKWLQTENSKRYGCEPSLLSWSKEYTYPEAKEGDQVRAAGFHLHLGYEQPSEEVNFLMGHACDLFLGIPSIVLEPENERKSTGYGLAGNIRHCNYGMEYRTLSSYFASSKELIEWSFRNFLKAVDFVNSGQVHGIENLGNDIQRIINTENKEDAKRFIKEFNLEIV